jgi:hypothetical protein
MLNPAARSFVVLWIVELAGNTRSSPGFGATPPAQFAPALQFPLTGVALQVFVAAHAAVESRLRTPTRQAVNQAGEDRRGTARDFIGLTLCPSRGRNLNAR